MLDIPRGSGRVRIPFACVHRHAAAARCKFVPAQRAPCVESPLLSSAQVAAEPQRVAVPRLPFLADQQPVLRSSRPHRCSGRFRARSTFATAGLGEMARCALSMRMQMHARTLKHVHAFTHKRTLTCTRAHMQARTCTSMHARLIARMFPRKAAANKCATRLHRDHR